MITENLDHYNRSRSTGRPVTTWGNHKRQSTEVYVEQREDK